MRVQAEPRAKKRVPCEVSFSGRRHTGIVLNLSRGGLYVQSNLTPRPGASLAVRLELPSEEKVDLEARVIWKRVVPARLRGLAHGGVGLRIRRASKSYYRFVEALLPTDAEAASASSAAAARRFRVRVRQTGGPRTRTLEIAADSEADARERAVVRLGDGWAVQDVQLL